MIKINQNFCNTCAVCEARCTVLVSELRGADMEGRRLGAEKDASHPQVDVCCCWSEWACIYPPPTKAQVGIT